MGYKWTSHCLEDYLLDKFNSYDISLLIIDILSNV